MLKIIIFDIDLHFFADQLRVAENAQAGAFENVPHTVGVNILHDYIVGIPAVYVDVDIRGNIHHLAQDVVSRGKQGIRPLFLAEFDNEKDDSQNQEYGADPAENETDHKGVAVPQKRRQRNAQYHKGSAQGGIDDANNQQGAPPDSRFFLHISHASPVFWQC